VFFLFIGSKMIKFYNFKFNLGYLFFGAGLFLLFYCSNFLYNNKLLALKKVTKNDLVSIEITASKDKSTKKYKIFKEEEIQNIITSIKNSTILPEHLSKEIEFKNTIIFNKTNGESEKYLINTDKENFYIKINSDYDNGWYYGTLKFKYNFNRIFFN
jgi:hypothetical protein